MPAFASPSAENDAKIQHLIEYIQSSNLTFVRNGEEHNGVQAAQHVAAKYTHFRSDISTPEDFIERAASKSILSGQPYLVKLADGSSKPLADWLREELNRK